MSVSPTRIRWFWAFGLSLLAAHAGLACSVPVFRYALERWAPDTFQATVFHRGDLTPEHAALVEQLSTAKANLTVTTVDLGGDLSSTERAEWEEQQTEVLPWLYVTYPKAHPVAVELEAGPLESGRVQQLLHSSLRQEISSGLIDGETAFWMQVDSGDKSADDAAWKTLNEQLEMLKSTLQLPTLEQEDIDAGLISVGQDDLRIAFTPRRIARDSEEERIFVRMLLDTEEDLLGRAEPMIFPVFGRGRVLYALVGRGIVAETIKEAAAYVVGACSCQVKAENPGVDLLMTAAWDELVQSSFIKEQPIPELTGLVEPQSQQTPTASASASAPLATEEPAALVTAPTLPKSDSKLILWTTIPALVLMLGILAVGTLMVLRKRNV